MTITKTLRSRTKTGWVTKPSADIHANRLTAEEVDDNFLNLEGQIETHEATHPAPTTRDDRNEVAGAVSGHESAHSHALLHAQDTDTNLGAVGTKVTPVDDDKVVQRDSANSDALSTSTWTQIKAFLKTYFDTQYNNYVHSTGNPVCNAAPNANNYVHPGSGTNPHGTTKSDVGLSGVPNTNASTANYLRGDGTWVTPPNTNTWRPMGTGSTDVFRADHASAAYSHSQAAHAPSDIFNPNLLVDGNFEYWDEGTSGSGYEYGPTMWRAINPWLRSTNAPAGSKYSMQLQQTEEELTILCFIPSSIARQLAGQAVTVSWWAQNVSNVSFTRYHISSFNAEDNSSAVTPRHMGTSFTTIDGTWRKFEQTFTLNANCANGFALYIQLGHTASLALDGRIAQVKLEPGTVATPFYQGPEERVRVNEYFCTGHLYVGGGLAYKYAGGATSNAFNSTEAFPTTMRTTPTIVLSGTTNYSNCSNLSTMVRENGFITRVDTTAAGEYRAFNNGFWTADARFYP